MICALFGVLLVAGVAFGGSPCPPRHLIYPCSCLNIEASRRTTYTAIICHRLPDSSALEAISHILRMLQIDQFQLYDSFWNAHKDSQRSLPNDWLRIMKVKGIEIVDTTLSNPLICEGKLKCKNNEITRFTVVNSSSSDTIDTCSKGATSIKYFWTKCMTKLEYFQFSHGKLTSLDNIFLMIMEKLAVLNFTHNQISRIDSKAFDNLPQLAKLDLSHNLLGRLETLYSKDQHESNLQFLDLSWNFIESLGSAFFKPLKQLKFFKADHNRIVQLKEEVWMAIPKSLKNIDLKGNPIHCGCDIRWFNNAFPKNVTIAGQCATPDDYRNSFFRTAALGAKKRCDESGNFRTKKTFRATTPIL